MHYDKVSDRDRNINAVVDFWIGDPCYVVPDDHWGPLCDNWQRFERNNPDIGHHYIGRVEHEPTGLCFYTWNTAYGDGTYKLFVDDKEVAQLCVDAGCLAAIPVNLLEHWREQGNMGSYEDLGHVVSADKLQGELVTEGGDAYWGQMRLPTGYNADEDEEEDPWCEDEGYFI